jgi:hypothetical protein
MLLLLKNEEDLKNNMNDKLKIMFKYIVINLSNIFSVNVSAYIIIFEVVRSNIAEIIMCGNSLL